jgi:hypothetical protein
MTSMKESFYKEVETIVIGHLKNNIKILLGDVYTKVRFGDQDDSAIGKFGICIKKRMAEKSNM